MCHQPIARPPRPPTLSGTGAVQDADLVLTPDDGARFAAFGAKAPQDGGAGVVILPDVRGLHPFYRDLAFRFAQAGIHACSIDYFGRTAGIGPRGDDFDFPPHVDQTRDGTIAMDVGAAIAHLRSGPGGAATAVFTVGFCFGGRNSFNQAARGHDLSGVIGFYGRVVRHPGDEEDTPVELASRYTAPVLGLFGGADRSIPREDVQAFRSVLNRAGIRNEFVVYDDAPHSFFDRSAERFRDACEDAWRRMLRFIADNTA